jgi:CubicO group peptidase (beta-lactamase class C family)
LASELEKRVRDWKKESFIMKTAENRRSLNPKQFRTIIFMIGSCLLLFGIGLFHRSARASGDETDFKAIDDYITAKMRSARIPGLTLAIVKGDQIVYLKGYGRADPSGRPVTPQTSFIIGSVTKAFTALAVMQLVEAGQVDLDAPVQQYLPWFRVADPQASAQITVRQLLNQTSGLPQQTETQLWNDQDEGALERSVRVLQTVELNRPVGTFGYSNANYNTLGLIVQAVSGQSYEEYVRQHIFAPLDMQHSFVSQDEAMQHGMARGHRWWFGIPVPVDLPYHRAELPAGFIISGAEDMAHFVIAQMNGGRYRDVSVLSPEGIALMQTEPVPHTYAMGWESTQINGRTLINHDGGYFNFQSSVFFDPEARVGVFVAANVMNVLDAFSSPPSSSLTGPTTRAMAQSVLAMATNQPMPDQGPGNALLTLIFDLVILGLTVWLIVSLVRIPRRYRRLAQHGIARRSDLVWRSGLIALLHFAWPLWVLYLALNSSAWRVYVILFQPDLGFWLQATATIVFLKGLLEIALSWRVFRQTEQRQSLKLNSKLAR